MTGESIVIMFGIFWGPRLSKSKFSHIFPMLLQEPFSKSSFARSRSRGDHPRMVAGGAVRYSSYG